MHSWAWWRREDTIQCSKASVVIHMWNHVSQGLHNQISNHLSLQERLYSQVQMVRIAAEGTLQLALGLLLLLLFFKSAGRQQRTGTEANAFVQSADSLWSSVSRLSLAGRKTEEPRRAKAYAFYPFCRRAWWPVACHSQHRQLCTFVKFIV